MKEKNENNIYIIQKLYNNELTQSPESISYLKSLRIQKQDEDVQELIIRVMKELIKLELELTDDNFQKYVIVEKIMNKVTFHSPTKDNTSRKINKHIFKFLLENNSEKHDEKFSNENNME